MMLLRPYEHAYQDIDTKFWQEAKIRQLEQRLNKCAAIFQDMGLSKEEALGIIKSNVISVVCTDTGEWHLHGISYNTGKDSLPPGWDWVTGCGNPYRGLYFTTELEIATTLIDKMDVVKDGKEWRYVGRLEDLL